MNFLNYTQQIKMSCKKYNGELRVENEELCLFYLCSKFVLGRSGFVLGTFDCDNLNSTPY